MPPLGVIELPIIFALFLSMDSKSNGTNPAFSPCLCQCEALDLPPLAARPATSSVESGAGLDRRRRFVVQYARERQSRMSANGNQIVVYQPDGVMKIDVRFDGETVWLLQPQIAELFSCSLENVRLHLKNIYACGELEKSATSKESLEVRKEGNRSVTRKFLYYNLDAIISIGYRVNSIVGVRFRQWATQVIKERMFAGAAVAAQFAVIDRRLMSHEKDIVDLKEKVDFFVQTQAPPLQGVFYDGQLWDARALALKLIGRAKRSLILIDNWATTEVLDLFAKKRKGVKVTIVTSEHCDKKHVPHRKISDADIATFNAQYPALAVRYNETFHDRFLIIDDKELYLIGASLKDLGKKCFGFTKMDAGEIRRIKKSAYAKATADRHVGVRGN